MPVLQSAYRPGHSTDSCNVKVVSDILDAADSGQVSLIGLLDLSAAFDTVDHEILLSRMELSWGITGAALNWNRSFLSESGVIIDCKLTMEDHVNSVVKSCFFLLGSRKT